MISIIMPVYNEEEYVIECLQSVANQMSENHELIIIDDGSTDRSQKLVLDFIKDSTMNISYHYKENGGLGSACNYGIKLSQKPYILFIDSDDIMTHNMLEVLEKKLKKFNKPEIIIFDIHNKLINGKTSHNELDFPSEELFNIKRNPEIINTLPSAKNKLFKKSVFIENDIFFPVNLWFEDLMTVTKVYLKVDSILYTKETYYTYIHRMDSIINNKNTIKNKDILKVVSDIVNYYKVNNAYCIYRNQLETLLIQHMLLYPTKRILNNSVENSSTEILLEITNEFSNYNIELNNYDFSIFSWLDRLLIKLILNKKITLLKKIFKVKKGMFP